MVQIHCQAYCWEDKCITKPEAPDATYKHVHVGDPKDWLAIWVPRTNHFDLTDVPTLTDNPR